MIRMTDKLRERIVESIKESFFQRAAAVNKMFPTNEEIGIAYYNKAIEPYRDIFKKLPVGFISQGETVRVRIRGTSIIKDINAPYNLPKADYVPDSCGSYGSRSPLIDWAELPEDLRKRMETATVELNALNHQRSTLVSEVKALLTKCNTLKDFITVWPTGMDYVPEDVKKQHEAPEVRGRKKKGEKEVIEVKAELDALVSLNKLLS